MYWSKCPKEWEEWESRRWKKTNSAALRENLTFQIKSSNRTSISSSLLPITPKSTLSVINRRKLKNPVTTFQQWEIFWPNQLNGDSSARKKMTTTGLPEVTGSAKTSSAQIHTLTPVETRASSRWKTFSPPARNLRPPRTRSSLRTNPKIGWYSGTERTWTRAINVFKKTVNS